MIATRSDDRLLAIERAWRAEGQTEGDTAERLRAEVRRRFPGRDPRVDPRPGDVVLIEPLLRVARVESVATGADSPSREGVGRVTWHHVSLPDPAGEKRMLWLEHPAGALRWSDNAAWVLHRFEDGPEPRTRYPEPWCAGAFAPPVLLFRRHWHRGVNHVARIAAPVTHQPANPDGPVPIVGWSLIAPCGHEEGIGLRISRGGGTRLSHPSPRVELGRSPSCKRCLKNGWWQSDAGKRQATRLAIQNAVALGLPREPMVPHPSRPPQFSPRVTDWRGRA